MRIKKELGSYSSTTVPKFCAHHGRRDCKSTKKLNCRRKDKGDFNFLNLDHFRFSQSHHDLPSISQRSTMAHSTILKLTTLLILTTLATAQVFCAQAIVTTKSYDCALIASAGSCPVNTALGYSYWAVTATGSTVTATGCCAATATPHSVENGIACCPCEASCMGYMPAMCEWNTDNGTITSSADDCWSEC